MSIEQKIEALTVATEKNTAQLGEVLAALQANTAISTSLHEGRAEALAALTAKDAEAPKPAPRTRKKKDDDTVTETADAPTEEPAAETTTAAAFNPDLSVEGMRAIFTGYMTGTSDEAEKKKRVANVQAILAELGADAINPMAGKKHIETEEDKRRAAFFVARFDAGLPVDFGADYDLYADPLTQGSAASSSSDDDLVG